MELIIKKSKFIGQYYFIQSNEQALNIISRLKEKYSDATHVCYAYVTSTPSCERMSDDGEPCGTAGRPILSAIKNKGLTDILVVVIRYFGGVKLGAGGLIRAYSSVANATITDVRNKVKMAEVEILSNIKNVDKIKGVLSKYGISFSVKFADIAKINAQIDCDKLNEIKQKLYGLYEAGSKWE